MDIEELAITLKMLDIEYIMENKKIYINSNYIYADNKFEIFIKKLLINNNFQYKCKYSQINFNYIKWFIIIKG
jgi:hypothetical protein